MLNYSLRQTAKILIVSLGLLMLPSIFAIFVDEASLGEMPIYYVSEGDYDGVDVMLFDPVTRMSTPILRKYFYRLLQLSANGFLAHFRYSSGSHDIWVMDVHPPLNRPLKIIEDPGHYANTPLSNGPLSDAPLVWSRDGRYLAVILTNADESKTAYVWDGAKVIDVTPSDLQPPNSRYYVSELVWSHDGRLAFTVSGNSREIYVWDGQTTINLSRDASRDDYAPAWDHTGRLAFVSKATFEDSKIMVWDGVSLKNGLPDKSTFVEVAPEFTNGYSIPIWVPDGRLAFSSPFSQNNTGQIYVWDGQTTVNLSQSSSIRYGSPVWGADGQWAFTEYSSDTRSITVRDTNNHTLLQIPGGSGPAWSAKGQLLFCKRGPTPRWSLQMWDGKEIFEITTGYSIIAQWPGGASVTCYN